jgi:hypothetical protein
MVMYGVTCSVGQGTLRAEMALPRSMREGENVDVRPVDGY